jgi:hypothetical protein
MGKSKRKDALGGDMVLSLRFHVLLYSGLLVWGLFELVNAAAGDAALSKMVLGVLYLVIAGYQLPRHQTAEMPVPVIEHVR